MSVNITPFRIDIEGSVLADMHVRLARTRLAEDPEGAEWEYGTNGGYLRELVDYWRYQFDWRAQEKRLNEVPQFVAEVDGARIHFAHQRGTGSAPLPIMLTHGWPTGYPEMTKLIPLLADPAGHGADAADSFDVIVPSFPGFHFSGPQPRGWGYYRTGMALHRLLTEGLGYDRFALHGTGAGLYPNGWITYEHPRSVIGFHTHNPTLFPTPSFEPPNEPMTDEESDFFERSRKWGAEEIAYAELHRTKPQSIGHALMDSPAGTASWLVEKHRTWSDCGGDVERRYTKDELLTGFSMYWLTGTIASSMRAYYERVKADPPMVPGRRFDGVPSGICVHRDMAGFPSGKAPRHLVERIHDVHHWVDLPSGGHFASWEEPELVAASIRDFFRPLR